MSAAVGYIDAVRRALDDELAADANVVVIGEDVAVGGPFGATKGLVERHGAERIRNTPICEQTLVGLAVGAATTGLRPVVEVMFIDFITLAMDPLVNHAAKLHFMSGGQLRVPMVVRTQQGTIGGAGAQHSQSLESWLTHVPGLRVVTPTGASDVYALLRAAIRSDDPVVFLEHKRHYRQRAPEDRSAAIDIRAGTSIVIAPGSDLTVVTYGVGVQAALAARDVLLAEGISLDVIGLRTLSPLNLGPVLASVQRTGLAAVMHEAVGVSGFGAELVARIQQEAWAYLRAPVGRLAGAFCPIPAAEEVEAELVPGPSDLVKIARHLVNEGSAHA